MLSLNVSYFWVTNYHRFNSLWQHKFIISVFIIYYFMSPGGLKMLRISEGWNQGISWDGRLPRGTKEESSSSSFRLLAEFISLWLSDWDPCCASCPVLGLLSAIRVYSQILSIWSLMYLKPAIAHQILLVLRIWAPICYQLEEMLYLERARVIKLVLPSISLDQLKVNWLVILWRLQNSFCHIIQQHWCIILSHL